MKTIKRFICILMVVALAIAGISYSWTFTPYGRLDYVPAVMSKLASWQNAQPDFSKEARASVNEMTRGMYGESVELAKIEDRLIPAKDVDIPIRIYWPVETDEALPLYLDIHGGGFWMGNGFVFHNAVTRFAAEARAIVVSVDYRLAPEHPFPAALDDCYAALQWMYSNAEALGGDPNKIAIGGSSAGGTLAAALTLLARDKGGPNIAFQYLEVPGTDISGTIDWPSYQEVGKDYVLTAASIETMATKYAPTQALRENPYVSPLLADDHSGLPPALIVTATFDPLRDQGEAYAKRLLDAGVPVTLHREQSLHGFMGSLDRLEKIQSMAATKLRETFQN